MTRTYRRLMAASLLAMSIAGCTKGNECDRCNSDDECKAGFVCSSFPDNQKRCGSGVGATTCRVR
jgi:hypothetical protein